MCSGYPHLYELCGCPPSLLTCSQPLVPTRAPLPAALSPSNQPHLLYPSEKLEAPDMHFSKSPPLNIEICFTWLSSTPAHKTEILSPKSPSCLQGVVAPSLGAPPRWPFLRYSSTHLCSWFTPFGLLAISDMLHHPSCPSCWHFSSLEHSSSKMTFPPKVFIVALFVMLKNQDNTSFFLWQSNIPLCVYAHMHMHTMERVCVYIHTSSS